MNSEKNSLDKAQDYYTTNWKNGKGTTLELASDSELNTDGTFGWRLSIATLSGSSDYSNFVGIDRSQILLQGDQVNLSINHNGAMIQRVLKQYDKAIFSGEDQVSYQLINCTVAKMFNVMTTVNRYRHRLAIHKLSNEMVIDTECDILLIFSLSNFLKVEESNQEMTLEVHDMLKIQSAVGKKVKLSSCTDANFKDASLKGASLKDVIIVELYKL